LRPAGAGWSKVEGSDSFNAEKGDYRVAITFYTEADGVGGMNILISKS
jgi:hypothetical protein